MARNSFATADDWIRRELLGAESLLFPRVPTPPAEVAMSTSSTAVPPFLAPNSSTTHLSGRSRGVPAVSPPNLDDLVWQWDEDEAALLNVDIDALCGLVEPGTSLPEQDETPAHIRSRPTKKAKTANVSGSVPAKKPRMRRKVEIALLRDESQKLEQKLMQLREYWKQASACAASNSKHQKLQQALDLIVNTEPLWKQIALHQREAATESEKQNNALRLKYKEQRKMLKTLRAFLAKRVALMKTLQEQYSVMIIPPSPRLLQIGRASSFQCLLDESAAMFQESDRMMQLVQVRGKGEQAFSGWNFVYEDSNDLRLELVDTFAVPFSRDNTERAIRQIFGADSTPNGQIDEYLDLSENTILRQFISSFNTDTGTGDVRVKQTLRRFDDGPRTIFVGIRTIERLKGDIKYGSELRESKWMMLCSQDGGNGSSVTTIQTYRTMRSVKMPAAYKALWCERNLRATLIPILDRGSVRLRHDVETLLIEDGIKTRKVFTSILVARMRVIAHVARDEGASTPPSLGDAELFAGAHQAMSAGLGDVPNAQQSLTSHQCEPSYLDALLLLDDDAITPVAEAMTGFGQAIGIPYAPAGSLGDVPPLSVVDDFSMECGSISLRAIAAAVTISENLATEDAVGKPKRRHNNTTRRRQKQELEYLRVKVEELEHELQVLRGRADDGSRFYKSPTSSEEKSIVHSVDALVSLEPEASSQSLWKRVARNQMEGKQRAEIENARLREMVANQLKIVKGLAKMLNKRMNEPEDTFSEERKRLRVSNESEASIFERLAKDLDQRYSETDKVFGENGLAASKTELQHTEMKVDAFSGMCMEFLDSKILPFGMQSSQDALWRSLARDHLRLTDGHYAVVERIDDFLTAKLAINLRHKQLQAQADVKLVAKRFLQEDRAVIVWTCQSDADGPMCGSDGIQLIDRGWTVVESFARADGMPASIVQSCVRVVPEFVETEAEDDQRVGLLTDLVTGSFLRNMSAFHQSAEDLLVGEAVRDGA